MRFKLLMVTGLVLVLVACGTAAAKEGTPKKAVVHMQPAATEYRTPQACKDAIASARKVFGIAADGMGVSADNTSMIPEIIDAIQAVDAEAIDGITERIKANTTKINGFTSDLTSEGATFNAAAAACD